MFPASVCTVKVSPLVTLKKASPSKSKVLLFFHSFLLNDNLDWAFNITSESSGRLKTSVCAIWVSNDLVLLKNKKYDEVSNTTKTAATFKNDLKFNGITFGSAFLSVRFLNCSRAFWASTL